MICLDWASEIIQACFHGGNFIICFVMEDFPENTFRKSVFNFLKVIWSNSFSKLPTTGYFGKENNFELVNISRQGPVGNERRVVLRTGMQASVEGFFSGTRNVIKIYL